MILDDIAEIMNSDTARRISRQTGLSRNKIYRMSNGLSFVLDYDTIIALRLMGYEIRIEKNSPEKRPPDML